MTHPIVKFGDVVHLNPSRLADPAAAGIERFVGLEHITPENLHIRSWGLVAAGTTFTSHFQPGQVLFGKRRAYQRKVAVVDFEGVCSSDIYIFEPKDPKVLLPELLPFICQSEGFFQHALTTSSGSLSPRTRWGDLANYEFPLPPLEEQRRIADLVWAVDDAVNKYSDLIGALCIQKSAFLKESLTLGVNQSELSESVIGKIPKDWYVDELSNLVVSQYGIVDGPFGSNLKSIHYRTSGIPIIQSGFVTSGIFNPSNYLYVDEEKFNEQKRSAVKGGDIVMAKIGENCGACAILPLDHPVSIIAGNCLKITPDNAKCLTEYVLYVMHFYRITGKLNYLKSITAQPAINIKEVKKLKIRVPPLPEQRQIVDMVLAHDDAIEKAIAYKDALNQVKKAMLEKLL